MPMQVPALALMFGNSVPRVEFKAASDLHDWGDMLVRPWIIDEQCQ